MTLALEFAAQLNDQHLTFAWNLPGINQLEDPFVVIPNDPEAAFDTMLINNGLKVLANTHTTEVTEQAINNAMENVVHAREAAITHAKIGALAKFPDDLQSPAIRAAGWRGMSVDELASFHNGIVSDVSHAAVPVLLEGAPAKAARLGLRFLAERGDPDCDPMCLAIAAGEVATKYSGTQYLTVRGWTEAYRATVAGRDESRINGDSEEVYRLGRVLDWLVDHPVSR